MLTIREEDAIDIDLSLSKARPYPGLVDENTYVAAIVGGDMHRPSGAHDRWLYSEFYALNHLFKGLGRLQAWVTCEEPRSLVQRFGPLSHGCKAVLSDTLLDSRELTMVDYLPRDRYKERFIDAVRQYGRQANNNGGRLVLFVFCLGASTGLFSLGDGTAPLTLAELKLCIYPNVRTMLITSSSYAQKWHVDSTFSHTAMTPAAVLYSQSRELQTKMALECGSVFASALIESLAAHEHSAGRRWGVSVYNGLRPQFATRPQIGAFNNFCRAVNTVCGCVVEMEHTLESRDIVPPEDLAGDFFDHVARRYALLDNGPSPEPPVVRPLGISSARHSSDVHFNASETARLRSCIRYFLTTNPTSWRSPSQRSTSSFLRDCHARGSPFATLDEDDDDDDYRPIGCPNIDAVEDQRNALSIIQYRTQFAQAVDYVVSIMGLPVPNMEPALLYDHGKWCKRFFTVDTESLHDWILFPVRPLFESRRFIKRPARCQGPPFVAMEDYMCAVMFEYYQLTGSMERTRSKVSEFFEHFFGLEHCLGGILERDRAVLERKRRWRDLIAED